ncbi:MAG: DUF1932 domain-containing protein [Microbacteriaceae bacterium]
MTRVAVLGLGEAGRTFAAGIAGALEVRGWDPADPPAVPGVERVASAAAAVAGAEAVLAFAPAAHAAAALDAALDALGAGTAGGPGVLYADFSTAAPALKRELAGRAGAAGLHFADVAIMAPVRRGAANTPLMASGPAAAALAALLGDAGLRVQVIAGQVGEAAARKLLRSMLVKGLTGVMIESLRAAEREGLDDWFGPHLVATLTSLDRATLAGLVDGTRLHAARRVDEMEAAARMTEQAGGHAEIARAVAALLRSVEAEGVPGTLDGAGVPGTLRAVDAPASGAGRPSGERGGSVRA